MTLIAPRSAPPPRTRQRKNNCSSRLTYQQTGESKPAAVVCGMLSAFERRKVSQKPVRPDRLEQRESPRRHLAHQQLPSCCVAAANMGPLAIASRKTIPKPSPVLGTASAPPSQILGQFVLRDRPRTRPPLQRRIRLPALQVPSIIAVTDNRYTTSGYCDEFAGISGCRSWPLYRSESASRETVISIFFPLRRDDRVDEQVSAPAGSRESTVFGRTFTRSGSIPAHPSSRRLV